MGVSAIAAMISVIIMIHQSIQSNKSLEAVVKQTLYDKQPCVYIQKETEEHQISEGEDGKRRFTITFNLCNIGNYPATIVFYTLSIKNSKFNKYLDFDFLYKTEMMECNEIRAISATTIVDDTISDDIVKWSSINVDLLYKNILGQWFETNQTIVIGEDELTTKAADQFFGETYAASIDEKVVIERLKKYPECIIRKDRNVFKGDVKKDV